MATCTLHGLPESNKSCDVSAPVVLTSDFRAHCRLQKHIAYAKSLAANSMAGYVIGLGDRHLNNILLDTRTAECAHIDLGIAFEGGAYLPEPETVPFRLTADCVDGLGVSGVEGVFRRSCEATMGVLRAARAAVITIVEVRCVARWAVRACARAASQPCC
jgi:serine-protein kinase ATM